MKTEKEIARLTQTISGKQIQWYISQVLHPKIQQDMWSCWLMGNKDKKDEIKKVLIFLYGQTKKWDTIKCFFKKEHAVSTN